ncbi:ribonuclease P protein component [Acuticoccus mangrovi]|uniref:Ribonuclease P protein component n=1 Tax=Acuticoccus mangrovi TaxID=2796142 RepID=A0A934IN16_9HYPH|nr:ribonuclease P protein component [Acuticoccus mangrovi]MBJ3775388.1 ribonuclease P protein component [Acuticoccus mangrovi]
MPRLKRRAEFKAVAKGVRVNRDAFTLQALRRAGDETVGDPAPRVGFTVTKKVGNAVVRNRIKRRLRALSDRMRDDFSASTDYVIVARRAALDAPFAGLGDDLAAALEAAGAKLNRPAVRKRA